MIVNIIKKKEAQNNNSFHMRTTSFKNSHTKRIRDFRFQKSQNTRI
jgi:hypothetical protein